MKYSTLSKHIKYWDNAAVQARVGIQGYHESIQALSATEKLCHYTVLMLKKCEKDNIPFEEFEIIMQKGMEEVDKKA